MTKHILTNTYSVLRGFSTDSKFVRPANISTQCINMMRLSDGTFAPRRGYQVVSDEIGGLGVSTYTNSSTDEIQPICIHKDGNLYIQKTGTLEIAFADPNNVPASYVTYEIYVDPSVRTDTQECDFVPYSVVDDRALTTDCIKFRARQLRGYEDVSIGTGTDTYSGTLSDAPLTPGSILFQGTTGGGSTLNIQDDGSGNLTGDVGAGTNTINYTTGAYDVTFSSSVNSVICDYRTTLKIKFNTCLGKGFGVASPYPISDVVTSLNAIPGVTATTTGDDSYPAAFIEIVEETIIPEGKSATLNWRYWESANRTVASTFSGLAGKINDDDFQIATFAPFDDVVYIGSKFDDLQKYDGQTVYKAGMPAGESPAAVSAGAGSIAAGTYLYGISYEQVDFSGRIIEGEISTSTSITIGGSENINVTVDNLLQGSGWNTGAAITNGAQAGVNTIVVDDGSGGSHTLQVGDKAYFLDTSSGDYVTRNVTAVTSTSITIDGATVNVSDNQPISNNLKVNVYRTLDGGSLFYLVKSIPNDSYNSTQVYLDSTTDASLQNNVEYRSSLQGFPRDPPPRSGIVVSYENALVFGQVDDDPDRLFFSQPNEPEAVPFLNNVILPGGSDAITGIGISGSSLIIFKNTSVSSIVGTLADQQFEVFPIAPGSNIGCVSHHSIVSISNLMYFLHTNGVYCIAETQFYPTDSEGNPVPISRMIDRIFREEDELQDRKLVLKRSVGVAYTKDNQYLLFIPAEDLEGPRAANVNSRVFMFDHEGKNWFPWTRVNAAGGWYVLNDDLYFQERQKKNNTITSKLYRQHRKYRLIDQVDHVTPIRVTWESSWEDLGTPRVRKKFSRVSLLYDNISSIYQKNEPKFCFYSQTDWVDKRISTRVDLMQKINSKKWSTDYWSWLEWSGYQDSFITVSMKRGTVAKSMKIGFQLNQLNTSFRFQGFQNEIAPDFRKTIVR